MSFIVIIICCAFQWFLNLSSTPPQWAWTQKYIAWMRQTFAKLIQGNGLFLVATLVLPIVIIVSLVFTIVYHGLGHVGYLIVSLLLLWYCIDITLLRPASIKAKSTSDLFLQSYQKIFAPLIWYFILGPVGLTLYVIVIAFRTVLSDQHHFVVLAGIVDWVPLRLLGLTFALAGNFGVVFQEWLKTLAMPLAENQELVVALGNLASGPGDSHREALTLLHRALAIWLILMALMSVGVWIK